MNIYEWIGCILAILVMLPSMILIVYMSKSVKTDMNAGLIRKLEGQRWLITLGMLFILELYLLVKAVFLILLTI